MNKFKLTETVVVAMSALLLTAAPARSNEFSNFFRDFVRTQTGGSTTADSVSQRETNLSNAIIAAINANQITAVQTQQLKDQFDRIKQTETQYRASGNQLDAMETASLNAQLNELQNTFNRMVANNGSTTQVLAPASGLGFDAVRGAQVLTRISNGERSGQLSSSDAQYLRANFNRLEQLEHSYRLSGGSLSPSEKTILTNGLNDIIAELDEKLNDDQNTVAHDNYGDLDAKRADIRHRIDLSLSNGSLTPNEAAKLRSSVELIGQIEQSFRQPGRHLDGAERDRLLADLDRVGGRLDSLIHSGRSRSLDITAKKAQLLKGITDGTNNGRLTSLEGSMLRREYNRIGWMEQRFRNPDGTMDSSNRAQILQELDRISSMLNQELNNRNVAGIHYGDSQDLGRVGDHRTDDNHHHHGYGNPNGTDPHAFNDGRAQDPNLGDRQFHTVDSQVEMQNREQEQGH